MNGRLAIIITLVILTVLIFLFLLWMANAKYGNVPLKEVITIANSSPQYLPGVMQE